MITKKELFIFSAASIAVLLFTFSGGKSNSNESISFDTKEDKLLVAGIKYENVDQALNKKKRIYKTNKDLRAFRKKLLTNNLDQVIKKAKESAPKKSANKIAVPKVAKKKEDQKKKEKKKKIAKKDSNIKPVEPLSPTPDIEIADTQDQVESKDLSSTTYTSSFTPHKKSTDSNNNLEIEEEAVAAAEKNAADSTVSSFNNTDTNPKVISSIYTELLESERFTEFEQLMSSDLSEKQRIQSYQDSLNFLFTKSDDDFQIYNNFIRSQFFNDKNAVIISKSLNNPKMTFDQVRYSVAYLNQMVIEWSSEGGNAVFKLIYQDNVQEILSQNEERRDLFAGLQSSIEAKSLLLSENTIEVSAN